jgi:hypothetical protein
MTLNWCRTQQYRFKISMTFRRNANSRRSMDIPASFPIQIVSVIYKDTAVESQAAPAAARETSD